MAVKSNLVIDQGADFSVDVVLTDVNKDPIDINSYEVRSKLKKYYTSSTGVDFTVTPRPEFSLFTISLTANQTSSIQAGNYVYDIELRDLNSNEVKRVVEGIVNVTPEVTTN